MIQKKYMAILAVILVLTFVSVIYSPYLSVYMIPQKVSDRKLLLVEETAESTSLNNQYLWFEYQGDNMVLHYRQEVANFTKICYLNVDGSYGESLLAELELNDDMAGTFLVMTEEAVELDLDGDGETESVWFTAKTDNNSCKTFYGYDHAFLQESIPIEINMNYWRAADLIVYGDYYTGTIQFETSLDINETREIEEGYVSGISYTNQEAGPMIITCEYNGEILVTSYTQETNILNAQHLRAMAALGILLLVTIVLIVLMHFIRNAINRRIYAY